MSEKKHSPQHAELLKKQALEQQEVVEVLNFAKKYGKPSAIAIVAVCALFLADRYFKSAKAGKRIKADAAFMQAHTADQYREILADYGSTPSAPLAMMGLAQLEFNAGRYDEAEALYVEFAEKHGKHEMAVQAAFNQITCREAKGQYGDAHTLYGKFVGEHRDSYLAPVAMMGQARCLEALGQFADAKRTYEDLVSFYPGSSWVDLAEDRMKMVRSKLQ